MSELHVVKSRRKKKILKPIGQGDCEVGSIEGKDGFVIDSQHLLISLLLPSAVKAFLTECEREVNQLCGSRYQHSSDPLTRWGHQSGSIVLGNQRVAIKRPRVRDMGSGKEVIPNTYSQFQKPEIFDQQVFEQGMKHVSQRDYEKGLPQIAASFGVSKSSISRSWVKSTQKQLDILQNRRLDKLNIVAVFIDGKRFSKLGVVIALGVGEDGVKHVLGIYQSATEHSEACKALLEDLELRGLPSGELLFVVDGGSGLNKALDEKYQIDDPMNQRAIRVRCYIHKWRNIEGVLDKKVASEVAPLYWAVRDARDMTMALSCSDALEASLKRHNVSALKSYLEAKGDLLAIHKLQIGAKLKKFFSTTNAIESLNYLLEEDTRRVKTWRSSDHLHRWLATACLHNEKRMRRVHGYRTLPALKVRLQEICREKEKKQAELDKTGTAA